MVISMCLLSSIAVFRSESACPPIWQVCDEVIVLCNGVTSTWYCVTRTTLHILRTCSYIYHVAVIFLFGWRTFFLVRNWFSSLFVSPIWQHLCWGVCWPGQRKFRRCRFGGHCPIRKKRVYLPGYTHLSRSK